MKLLLVVMLFSVIAVSTTRSVQNATMATCTPSNWSYSWSNCKDVWYTETKNAGTWEAVTKECRDIEAGRTTIGSIRSEGETSHLKQKSLKLGGWVWIGGIRVGLGNWFWYDDNKGSTVYKKSIVMTNTNWMSGKPIDPAEYNTCCLALQVPSHEWSDAYCRDVHYGICELRC